MFARKLRELADNRDPTSFGNKLRRRRFAILLRLLEPVPKPVRILDLGGTVQFWRHMGYPVGSEACVTVLNLVAERRTLPGVVSVAGDATDLSEFDDGSFDVVFSNSVIEHVGTWDDQRRMAEEIRRVGCRYFIQTPNRHFPIEPHFFVPFFQYLPVGIRARLVYRFDLGWERPADRARARQIVEGVRLLTRRDVSALFPEATILTERFAGLPKSFLVLHGWEEGTRR